MKKDFSVKTIITCFVAALGLAGLAACGGSSGGGNGGGGTKTAAKATIAGQATGSGGLEDVSVSAGGVSTTTDKNGFYLLKDAEIPSTGRLVITFEKDGYATYQRSIMGEANKTYSASAKLAAYDINENSVDQTAPEPLEAKADDNTLKGKLELQADSLSGAAAGNVKVSMAVGDPSTEAGRQTFPGDYMAAESAGDEPDIPLISLAFGEITIKDADGKEITQLTKPAAITLRLPDEYQTGGKNEGVYDANDPNKDSIEWWSYDETNATWIREDADLSTPGVVDDAEIVEIDNLLYVKGEVMHFTWWNADQPISTNACLCTEIVDGDGNPKEGIEVFAEGVSYNGTSYPGQSDGTGKVCVNVLRSSDTKNETVKLVARSGNAEFTCEVTSASEGDVNNNYIYTPTQQGSTRDKSGHCVDLENKIEVSFKGIVQGVVTFETSGSPADDFTIYSDFGPNAETNSNGVYQMNVPLNVPILLYAPGLASKSVTVTDENTPEEVNFVISNKAPVVALEHSPSASPASNGQKITFTTTASDPDGDELTYSYTASAGSPATGSNSTTFVWTAPSKGMGTAIITVTVSDGRNGETSKQQSIAYGGYLGGTSLKIVVKDDPVNNQPVSGVYAVLHASDNKTVEQSFTTGTDGVANFGDIGRNTASFSLAYEGTGVQNQQASKRQIDSFVDVPVGDIVYYIDAANEEGHHTACDTPAATVSTTLQDVPETVAFVTIEPLWQNADGSGTITDVSVCPGQIQTDGKLSLLATGSTSENITSSYTFLTDQTVTDGATYTLPGPNDTSGWRTPLQTTWNVVSETQKLDSLYVSGHRKGIWYNQIGSWSGYGSGASAGTIALINEFSMDNYWVDAYSEESSNGTVLWTSKKYDQLPMTLPMPLADYSIDTLGYDVASELLSWSVSGSSEKDLFIIELSLYVGDTSTEWRITLPPTSSSWTVFDLPTPLNEWVTANAISYGSFIVVDYDIVTGFDEAWAHYILGSNLEIEAEKSYGALRWFEGGMNAQRSAARRSSEAQTLPGSIKKQIRAFSGLNRR